MRVFRHPRTGALHIWTILKWSDKTVIEQYYYYTLKEAISKFRQKYPASVRKLQGCEKSNYCPFMFN